MHSKRLKMHSIYKTRWITLEEALHLDGQLATPSRSDFWPAEAVELAALIHLDHRNTSLRSYVQGG